MGIKIQFLSVYKDIYHVCICVYIYIYIMIISQFIAYQKLVEFAIYAQVLTIHVSGIIKCFAHGWHLLLYFA